MCLMSKAVGIGWGGAFTYAGAGATTAHNFSTTNLALSKCGPE